MSEDHRGEPVAHLRARIAEAQKWRSPSVTLGFAEAVELERMVAMPERRYEVVATMHGGSYQVEANIDTHDPPGEVLLYLDNEETGFVGVIRVPNEGVVSFCKQLLSRLEGGG